GNVKTIRVRAAPDTHVSKSIQNPQLLRRQHAVGEHQIVEQRFFGYGSRWCLRGRCCQCNRSAADNEDCKQYAHLHGLTSSVHSARIPPNLNTQMAKFLRNSLSFRELRQGRNCKTLSQETGT